MISILRRKQWKIPRWGYWLFFIIGGFFLILIDDVASDDSYGVIFLSYFLLLFLTISRWAFNQIRLIIQLRKEKTTTELIHLQSQVNPHFFFNTLNNLYGWVGKDPKQAQAMILKLSDMMRYSIYDGQEEFVTLAEEIQYLNNYMELHQMRYHKKIDIAFELEVEDEAVPIRPLLFIILLENAFKHGVEKLGKDACINMSLSSTAKQLSFTIENNFEQGDEHTESGIGLMNLQRRLELVYPKHHTLKLSTQDNIFKAALTLDLAW